MHQECADYLRRPIAARAMPPLPRAHRAQNSGATSTPSPTDAVLLLRSPEKYFAGRTSKDKMIQGVAAVPPKPAPYRPASRSRAAASTGILPALLATPASPCEFRNSLRVFRPAAEEKFPSGIQASSR